MNCKGIILKRLGFLLLVVMSYNFFCSTFCAVGDNSCCGRTKKEHHNKCCASTEKSSDKKKSDCQDTHIAFFKTLGQFGSVETIDAAKVFYAFVAVDPIVFDFPTLAENKNVFVYNGFHPPPPKAGVRVFIHSFQI